MRRIAVAGVIATILAITAPPLSNPLPAPQNRIVKKNCTPDACIKAVRQKGYPFASAASWCAAHNNGC